MLSFTSGAPEKEPERPSDEEIERLFEKFMEETGMSGNEKMRRLPIDQKWAMLSTQQAAADDTPPAQTFITKLQGTLTEDFLQSLSTRLRMSRTSWIEAFISGGGVDQILKRLGPYLETIDQGLKLSPFDIGNITGLLSCLREIVNFSVGASVLTKSQDNIGKVIRLMLPGSQKAITSVLEILIAFLESKESVEEIIRTLHTTKFGAWNGWQLIGRELDPRSQRMVSVVVAFVNGLLLKVADTPKDYVEFLYVINESNLLNVLKHTGKHAEFVESISADMSVLREQFPGMNLNPFDEEQVIDYVRNEMGNGQFWSMMLSFADIFANKKDEGKLMTYITNLLLSFRHSYANGSKTAYDEALFFAPNGYDIQVDVTMQPIEEQMFEQCQFINNTLLQKIPLPAVPQTYMSAGNDESALRRELVLAQDQIVTLRKQNKEAKQMAENEKQELVNEMNELRRSLQRRKGTKKSAGSSQTLKLEKYDNNAKVIAEMMNLTETNSRLRKLYHQLSEKGEIMETRIKQLTEEKEKLEREVANLKAGGATPAPGAPPPPPPPPTPTPPPPGGKAA